LCLDVGRNDLSLTGDDAGLVDVDGRDVSKGVDTVESDDL
jgi:hypothetical protein